VLRLGLQQGMLCLGCCWAMMALMFALGAMNVVWMAALGVLMTIEKLSTTARFSEAVGFVFVAVGFGMIVWSVV
jgi:predicted metal-binding membrane protein